MPALYDLFYIVVCNWFIRDFICYTKIGIFVQCSQLFRSFDADISDWLYLAVPVPCLLLFCWSGVFGVHPKTVIRYFEMCFAR